MAGIGDMLHATSGKLEYAEISQRQQATFGPTRQRRAATYTIQHDSGSNVYSGTRKAQTAPENTLLIHPKLILGLNIVLHSPKSTQRKLQNRVVRPSFIHGGN